jgi:hypothetical protein
MYGAWRRSASRIISFVRCEKLKLKLNCILIFTLVNYTTFFKSCAVAIILFRRLESVRCDKIHLVTPPPPPGLLKGSRDDMCTAYRKEPWKLN